MNLSDKPSKVTLLAERRVDEPNQPQHPPTLSQHLAAREMATLEATTSPPSNHAFLAQTTAVLSAIAMMLAARIILMLAMIGAFILAYSSIVNPTPMTLMATASFDVLVVIPLVALYWQRG